MAKMNGVTATVRRVVCVEIVGRRRGEDVLPEDDGLVAEFLRWWSAENQVFGTVSRSGAGSFLGYFDENSAERIKAWFTAKGFKI